MQIFDGHCDVLYNGRDINLLRNNGQYDIERAMSAGYMGQVFAAFGKGIPDQLASLAAYAGTGKFCVVPAVEGCGEAVGLDDISSYIGLGARLVGLTWNLDNSFAGGCEGSGTGLTALGRGAVELCGEHNVIMDLSHASERTFYDVSAMLNGPFAVTHTCCGALFGHRRNLSDGQLRAAANSGGVVGIAYCTLFLGGASICDVTAHIEHAVKTAGEDHVGLGSDFNGTDDLPDGISEVRDTVKILEKLSLPERVKEKVAGGNWMRLLGITHCGGG